MAEDLLREAASMLPRESGNAHQLLLALLDKLQPDDFPSEIVRQ